ncbi:hypothetical protein HY383_01860 [Candidatus Daviesbacteria bacterium]|nr:hypothetical protein [Candidatus Daviesbacteria bacterium]
MADIHFLNVLEFERFKSLLSGKTLTLAEKISALDTLREKLPDLFANLTAGLSPQQLKDNLFLIRHLTNSRNINKIKLALRKESSLSPAQQLALELALEEAATKEPLAEQATPTAAQTEEAPLPSQPNPSASSGFGGMPSAGMSSSASGRVFVKEAPTSGKAGGTGQGTAATNKINRANVGKTIQFPKAPASFVNTAKNFSSSSQIFTKRWGGRIFNGLTQVALPGGASLLGKTGLGAINHGGNFISNLSNTRLRMVNNIKGAGSGLSSSLQGGKKFALASVLAFFLLLGIAISGATNGTTPTSEAAPISTGGTDISNCKFTRSGKPQPIKSSILSGWISSTAVSAGIPSQILAGIAMHENPNFLQTKENTDEEIKTNRFCNSGADFCVNQDKSKNIHMGKCTDAEIAAGNSNASAIGLMQIVDVHYPEVDLCNIQTNIALAAQIFKGKLGSGSINSEADLKKAVCLYYGAQDDTECTYEEKYHYGQEVWNDYQNCQTTSAVAILPAPVNGDHKSWVNGNFNIDVSELPDQYALWAYEVLNASTSKAPKFRGLIYNKPTKVVPATEGSYTSGDTINIRAGYDANFFKQIFIHELGHRIKGAAGTTSPQCGGETLEQIQDREKYLTYYAENATPANVKSPACGSNDQATKSDEDFAESVSYYINNIPELNYGSDCSTYGTVNPYNRTAQSRPLHKAYIQCLLGP